MKKMMTFLKKAKSEGFYACGDVSGLTHHQRTSLALCT